MANGFSEYGRSFSEHLGRGWNRFWFSPRDPVGVCLLRILVGAIACVWYFQLGMNFHFLFGEDGLLPYDRVVTQRGYTVFSLFDWVRDTGALNLVFWGGLAVLLAFTAGLFSRITNVLSLVLVVSILHRKILLATPLEDVLTMPLFYLCFAPTGARYSLDALFRRKNAVANPQLSYAATIATRLIQIHVAAIYVLMTIAKLRADGWSQGTAIWWLNVKSDGRLLDLVGMSEIVANFWTIAHLLFEGTFAIFIWNRWTRPLVLAVSALMWFGFALATGQVLFSALMLVLGGAFVSPEWLRSCCLAEVNAVKASGAAVTTRG